MNKKLKRIEQLRGKFLEKKIKSNQKTPNQRVYMEYVQYLGTYSTVQHISLQQMFVIVIIIIIIVIDDDDDDEVFYIPV